MDDDDVEIGDECRAETEVEIDKMLERAMQNGLPAEKEAELRRIVSTHADVFRTRLGADPVWTTSLCKCCRRRECHRTVPRCDDVAHRNWHSWPTW
jgi:hypothetical protein